MALLKLAMNDDNKVKVAAAGAIPPPRGFAGRSVISGGSGLDADIFCRC